MSEFFTRSTTCASVRCAERMTASTSPCVAPWMRQQVGAHPPAAHGHFETYILSCVPQECRSRLWSGYPCRTLKLRFAQAPTSTWTPFCTFTHGEFTNEPGDLLGFGRLSEVRVEPELMSFLPICLLSPPG